MRSLGGLVHVAATPGNPIDALRSFLDTEESNEKAKQIDKMRFVGYVLELGYETAMIITSDPYKLAVGGIPRGSFLIMTPSNSGNVPLHFTLLRVTGVSTTPLSGQIQQTYFELHKKSMPELDVWTQGELQWGALGCDVLGMFYADPANMQSLAFSGDVNNVMSAHRYKVFAPDDGLLNVIVNGMVKADNRITIGTLRTMECGLVSSGGVTQIPVLISMKDFKGCRTAMFGKTRLGKSNVVKLIAKGMLDATAEDNSVGQLIFDINGEYANDNPQDGNKSLRSADAARCEVYAPTLRKESPSRPLRLNFFELTESGTEIFRSMLAQDNKTGDYIKNFTAVQLPAIEAVAALPMNEKIRAIRKIQMYWAILYKAGFEFDEARLRSKGLVSGHTKHFDPHFNDALRTAAYAAVFNATPPPIPDSLNALRAELEVMSQFCREHSSHQLLNPASGKPPFDADDLGLLGFLKPATGRTGPAMLRAYMDFHSPRAGAFVAEILAQLDQGLTVVLDLGNATDEMRRYFADMLSRAVFSHQETKFVENRLGNHFIQLFFEEAHNLFPPEGKDLTGVYARFAKEGAKFHIGMVYSTQSPSTINKELLARTENFFVGHLSSLDETKSLARVQVAFNGVEVDILRAKTPGYMRMLTLSHRFIVPVQAFRFEATPAAQTVVPVQ